jgi:hypothetical protein
MKKTLVVAAGLAVLSTSAFASKARMQAMGQDATLGSFYMQDTRNIWRMPHSMNANSNFVITEWGDQDATSGQENAEGGFFNSAASMNYGIYLNADALGNVQADSSTNNPTRFDIFVGGNSNMNWGARLGYETITNKTATLDEDATGFDLSVSAELSGANVYLTYVAAADATIEGNDEQNNDLSLGATYMMNDYTLFGEYRSEGNAGDTDATTSITLGAGSTMAMSDSSTVFYDVKLVSTSDQNTGVIGATDASSLAVPVTFGVEAKANSWLTWRASISQPVINNTEYTLANNAIESSSRSTTLGVGASLTYGNLQLDGTLSNGAGTGELGASDDVLTNVSMTYVF